MKVQVFDTNEGPEKVVNLKLFNHIEGGVFLAAVDDEGRELSGSRVLWINKKGILGLYEFLNQGVGLKVDGVKNQIVIEPL